MYLFYLYNSRSLAAYSGASSTIGRDTNPGYRYPYQAEPVRQGIYFFIDTSCTLFSLPFKFFGYNILTFGTRNNFSVVKSVFILRKFRCLACLSLLSVI